GPEEVHAPAAPAERDGVEVRGPETVEAARAGQGRADGSPVREVPLPGPGGAVILVARVPGRGKVEGTGGGDGVDGLGDGPVLERRLREIRDVVDDDVAARG